MGRLWITQVLDTGHLTCYNGSMKRIKFYTIHCTTEERDKGIEHYEAFNTKEQAIKRAKEISNDEFISVEKHNEKYERNNWLPDWDMEDWCENIDFYEK